MGAKIIFATLIFLASHTLTLAKTTTVTPNQSIQNIVNEASSGDIIQVTSGIYPESIRLSKNNLTIRCEQSRQCTVRRFEVYGSNDTVEGFKITGGEISGLDIRQNNNVLKDIDIYDILYSSGDANGIILFGAGHVFDNIYIHDIDQYDVDTKYGYSEPHQDCFQTWDVPARGGVASNITIRNILCDMPESGDSFTSKAIQVEGGAHDWNIQNFVSLAPMACLFIDDAYNIVIEHSTFIGSGIDQPQGCKFLKINNGPTPHDNSIMYSIFQNITSGPVIYETADAVRSSNNCYWKTSSRSPESGDVYANPILASDYSVPSNSPCTNMGAKLSPSSSSPTTPTPSPSPTPKPGDLNGDDSVNLLDFNKLISLFGNPYTLLDFNAIIRNYGS